MAGRRTEVDDRLHDYILANSLRESEVLRRLREETASLPHAGMQIGPERGQFMALLVELMGARRIALLTPYLDEINHTMRGFSEARGVSVPVMGSFNEPNDNKVGRISPESIRAAALELGHSDLVDAVFVACTALRMVEIAAEIEAEVGKPVTSSNHAMAWHCLRLAGIEDTQPHLGRLFTLKLAG